MTWKMRSASLIIINRLSPASRPASSIKRRMISASGALQNAHIASRSAIRSKSRKPSRESPCPFRSRTRRKLGDPRPVELCRDLLVVGPSRRSSAELFPGLKK